MSTALPDPFGFGQDLSCNPDFTPDMRECSGIECLAQDLLNRLMTPRGSLVGDPNYGTDIRDFVSKGMDARELLALPGVIAAELQKDDRVRSVRIKILKTSRDSLEAQFFVLCAQGPSFPFTANITTAQALLTQVG